MKELARRGWKRIESQSFLQLLNLVASKSEGTEDFRPLLYSRSYSTNGRGLQACLDHSPKREAGRGARGLI